MHNENVAGLAAGRGRGRWTVQKSAEETLGQEFRSTSTAFSATSSRRIRSGSRKP